jgi:predicted MFS family arabinose efflux permease
LHTEGRLYGLLSTAFGVGAVIGGLASGRVVRWIGARTLLWLGGVVVAGPVVLVYARQTVFAAVLFLIMLIALAARCSTRHSPRCC